MFGSMSLRVIESFAAQLGLRARPAADGSFSFVFARTGTLTLTPIADSQRIVVSLARDIARAEPAQLRRWLASGGHELSTDRLIHCGLAPGGALHLALNIDEASFDLPTLDGAFEHLALLHDRLQA